MNIVCDVTVIGLGAMGSVLAQTLVDRGYKVAVWNRTPSRMEPLIANGAVGCASVSQAVAASPLTIMCVLDYGTANDLLGEMGVADQLNGRTLVQLSTGKLEQVAAQSEQVKALGGRFIAGGIMASPHRIGDEHCMVLYAGDPVFEDHAALLMSFGGASRYLGDDPARAIGTYFTLGSMLTASQCMFYEAVAMARRFGVGADKYIELARITLKELEAEVESSAQRIANQDYDGSVGTVNTFHFAMLDVVQSLRTTGIEPRIVQAAVGHLQTAMDGGFGEKDVSCLVESMQPR